MSKAIQVSSRGPGGPEVITDALRLSAKQFEDLLAQLDEASRSSAAAAGRVAERFIFEAREVILEVKHPGGSVAHFLIRPRNISEAGIGFLHGGFLYPQSRCAIVMARRGGDPLRAEGEIAWVRHVTGRVHEVGVRFDHPVDLDGILAERRMVGERNRGEAVEPRLRGRVLYVERSPQECKHLASLLHGLGLRVESESSAVKAVGWVTRKAYDLVLIGEAAEGAGAMELGRHIRESGYMGSLIALRGKDAALPDAEAVDSPFTACLEKMKTEAQALEALAPYLAEAARADP